MKMIDDVIIIGIDSGYGNIKTANCCFPASVSAYDKEPVFKENLLVYESKFYLIGEGHKEFLADKTRDLDYYVLALAAIARELNIRKMTCGKIRIAAGLPLTWVSGQRDEFRDYLLQNKAVDFSFRNVSYHVEIVGVDVFPQGFAAVADRLSDFRGVNMICDIGNGTMNIMFINDKKPVSGNMFTEKSTAASPMCTAMRRTPGRFPLSARSAICCWSSLSLKQSRSRCPLSSIPPVLWISSASSPMWTSTSVSWCSTFTASVPSSSPPVCW